MEERRENLPDTNVLKIGTHEAPDAGPKVAQAPGSLGVRLCRELLAARAAGQRAQLLVFRISNFDLLIDTFGSEFGAAAEDAVMRQLHGAVRKREPVQRIRPGEFGIVGRGIRSDRALAAMAARLIGAGTGRYEIAGTPCRVKLQIGAAACPDDSTDPEQLLHFARFALCDVEETEAGYQSFSKNRLARRKAIFKLEAEMEQALEEQRFRLHYQPQFSVKTGDIVGVEALVRLAMGDGTLLAPDTFIPIAEDNGFILRLGHWIIGEACQQLRLWREAGFDVPRVSINLSPRQLVDDRLLQVIDAAVAEAGIHHKDLELEITERCMVVHSEEVSDLLRAIRGRGIRVAIDDFGTGYSSFAYLAWQPLDMIKLDRSFLARVGEDSRIDAVVSGMLTMARSLGLEVIAEGVENDEQAAFLAHLGCDMAQGFGLGRPQDAATIIKTYANQP